MNFVLDSCSTGEIFEKSIAHMSPTRSNFKDLPYRSMEIRRLNFDRGESINGEWRKVDWTVCRRLSQWAQSGSFKRLDQPEMLLAHRLNDFRPALASTVEH